MYWFQHLQGWISLVLALAVRGWILEFFDGFRSVSLVLLVIVSSYSSSWLVQKKLRSSYDSICCVRIRGVLEDLPFPSIFLFIMSFLIHFSCRCFCLEEFHSILVLKMPLFMYGLALLKIFKVDMIVEFLFLNYNVLHVITITIHWEANG